MVTSKEVCNAKEIQQFIAGKIEAAEGKVDYVEVYFSSTCRSIHV
jgi:hypothetical protein